MDSFVIEIAGLVVEVGSNYVSTRDYCRDFWCDTEASCSVRVTERDIAREQELLDLEADLEGLKRRKFSGPFLERSVIQRRVAELLVERNTVMLHGSTVAVDGQAYLFTAACGTGKSTHTRLWRELFGERAVMVNDDKPFLQVTDGGVLVFGSPWMGKHGLGNNIRAPLRGICILTRGPNNRIWPIGRADAVGMLRSQIYLPEGRELSALELLEQIMEYVPLWHMECTCDQDAARIAYDAMSI